MIRPAIPAMVMSDHCFCFIFKVKWRAKPVRMTGVNSMNDPHDFYNGQGCLLIADQSHTFY